MARVVAFDLGTYLSDYQDYLSIFYRDLGKFIENYKDAAIFFEKALVVFTFCIVKTDSRLTSLYYNYGKTVLKLKQYIKARNLIEYSFLLKNGNKAAKKLGAEDFKKITEAITECRKGEEETQKTTA